MRQYFMHLVPSNTQLPKLKSRLESAGFRVAASRRAAGGIDVRVRADTEDEAEVERIVAEVASGATRGPDGAPTMSIEGYREGF